MVNPLFRRAMALLVAAIIGLPGHPALALPQGDVDRDGAIGLGDALLALQFAAGMRPAVQTDAVDGDVDGDLAIGTAEALYGLQVAAGVRVAEHFAHVYDVGPGQPLAEPGEVPWESLAPGTLVRIHYREQPYAAKWVIPTTASAEAPVVVRGISSGGARPVVSGIGAVTRLPLSYWNEGRSVVKIGGSNHNDDPAAHIAIENLEIRSARPPYTFLDDTGAAQSYTTNAAAVHIEEGEHIAIRNCVLSDSGNGLFVTLLSSHILVEGNFIHGNGIEGSIYEHNSYTEARGIVFQYNRYGPLRAECLGNNLKDRSAGTLIRHNWIEAGNRALDLVESDSAELIADPAYRATHVYGNVLLKEDSASNGQVVHYGGDGGDLSRYRKGTLWFYNNTVVSTRGTADPAKKTTLLRLSSNDESAKIFNNIIFLTASGSTLAILDGSGVAELSFNLLPDGWRNCHGILSGTLDAHDNVISGDPGFADYPGGDYTLTPASPARDAGTAIPAALLPDHAPQREYVRHQRKRPRPADAAIDMGAFEGMD
jgi:hypothetical protein